MESRFGLRQTRAYRWLVRVAVLVDRLFIKFGRKVESGLQNIAASRPVRLFISQPLRYKQGEAVLATALVLGGGYLLFHNLQYKISLSEQKLLSRPTVDLKMIKQTKDGFTYNHAKAQQVDGHSITTAAAQADSTGKFPYEVTLPKNSSKGITFGDSTGNLSFTITPNFSTAGGREDKGRVIYPEGLNTVHAYTFKRNGVKEDIILSKKPGSDTYTKSWRLSLGDKLEARMMPNGAVGIYSANSMLFGNVQADNPADQALIDKARKNGQKDSLAFVIPAPYVTYANGQKDFAGAKFSLNANKLILTVSSMKGRTYPLSIDPTLVVTTTADFQAGTDDDGMIDWSTSGQINRSDISYGAASSMVQQTSAFTTARYQHTSVVYKGYLYIIGGTDSTTGPFNDIQYCPLNSDGSVGTCTQQANAFSTARYSHTSVVYNGYLYIIGGHSNTSNSACNSFGYCNDIQYCPLNSNGSVGTCTQQLSAFTGARYGHSSVVYNGYLYIIAGANSGRLTDIQYCPLNSNGSVGSCTQQASALSVGRYYHSSVVYNGYLYIIGGNSGSVANDILYCPFNNDGSVGACTQKTSAFTTQRWQHTSVVNNGYLYIIGGVAASNATGCDANGFCNDIQYCPLNSNGSVGACTQQTSAFTGTRGNHSSVAYNSYLYIVGGNNAVGGGYQNDIQYGLLGKLGSVQTTIQQTSAFSPARAGQSSVAYNGYLYIIGGAHAASDTACNATASTYCSDVVRCPFNSDGSIGSCIQQTSVFTNARVYQSSVAYNGYLYIIGGIGASTYDDIQYCPINSSGSIGACTQQTSAFTTARYEHTTVVSNGFIYIIGGYSGSYLNDIQYASINSNGSLSCPSGTTCSTGVFTRQASAFTTGRASHTSVVNNGYLYIIGGIDTNSATTGLSDIQYCPLNSNGSVGTCSQQTSAFTTGRWGHTSVISNGNLYIIGGRSNPGGNTTYYNDIQYCPLNSNGSVGTCTQQSAAYTSARAYHTSVLSNGYLYIIGGSVFGSPTGCSSTYCSDIQHIAITGGTLGSVGSTTQQTSAFTTARQSHTSVLYNGYLYIIGGYNGSDQNDIQHCPINANGSVGTCTQQTNAFTGARDNHASVVYNGYLYIIGGRGASFYNDIQYCPINSNGSVGTCTQQTSAFTTARYGHASVVYNGYLYIIGGKNSGSAPQNDIQYCPLNSNGSVGTCTQQTSAFTSARGFHSSVVYNGYLYIIGGAAAGSAVGCDTSGFCNDIQYCPLNSNGSVGTCTQQQGAFTLPREFTTAVVNNGELYIAGGGAAGGSLFNDIQTCPLNANGSVATCSQQTGAFTNARAAHTSVIYNGYLYIIGGTDNVTPYYNDIQYLKISDRGFGGVGSATQQTSAFTSAREGQTSVVYNGYLYIIGGYNGSRLNDIQYCPVNSNGSVGTCTQQTNAFTTARSGHTSVAYNGYLYIIGGIDGSFSNLNDIQYCPMNSNGSVGTCTQQANAFTWARNGHASLIYNGYLYIIGGSSSSCSGGNCNDIQYCQLNSNGSVGTCTQQTAAFTNGRTGLTSVVYNGYLYLVGGSGIKMFNDIQYCPLNSNGSTGSCTDVPDAFSMPRYAQTSIANNGYLYIVGGWNGTNYYNDIQDCPLNSNGSVGSCNQIVNAFTSGRYFHSIAQYNGYLYVIGGNASGTDQNDIQYLKITGPLWKSKYERVLDVGFLSTNLASIVYNGATKCSATLSYKTADTSGVFGSTTTLSNTQAGTSYTINAANMRYLWVTITMDDSSCGGTSNVTDVTLTYLSNPSMPTLNTPTINATDTVLQPTFQMRSSDPNNDYIRYKIDVCSTSNCSSIVRTVDQTASQTGWTGQDAQTGTAYVGSSTITSSTMANYTYQTPALNPGTQYWWRAYAIDPAGDNVWSSASAIQTFTTSAVPAAPTLVSPTNSATGVSATTTLQLRTTDADNDYLKYKIDICTTSNCSSVLQTIDQTSSQTGWAGQDAQSGSAYVGNSILANSTLAAYSFQSPTLKANTQYWWRAYAIDPGGSNTFSSASSIGTFTTAQNETFLKGGINFGGGVHFGN